MGLMRKAVRRATPRPVRKVKRVVTHPVRTGVRAVTPRPIRNAERAVFNATHPINAAENALLNGLTNRPRARAGTRRQASSAGGGYYSTGPGSAAAAYERAVLAEQIQRDEASLFSRHTGTFEAPAVLEAPSVQPPDPGPIRARLEHESGIKDLQAELAPFGNPPVAPDPPSLDEDTVARQLFRTASAGASWVHVGQRRRLRAESRAEAERQVRLQNERNVVEKRRQQDALNKKQSRLDRLHESVEANVQAWISAEVAEREAARAKSVAAAQAFADRLRANEPKAVAAALAKALASDRVKVVGSAGGQATISLVVPDGADVIAAQEPAYTPAGRLTLRKRSKTQLNRLYTAAIASEVLRTARVAFAAAPALKCVRCVVMREDEFEGEDAIYAGTITRALCSHPNTYSHNPASLAPLLELAEDVHINRRGRTGELCPLDVDDDVLRALPLAPFSAVEKG
jgi:hypothetical protein